jgi:hypothetical protein
MGHVVFRPLDSYPENPPIAPNATPEFAECLKLEAQILRNPANWKEPAARMEKILTSLIEKNDLRPRDFRPSYYGAFLTRYAIGDNDYHAAFRYLQLGLAFPQDREQLFFLTRVLDRIVPPDVLEEFRSRDKLKSLE